MSRVLLLVTLLSGACAIGCATPDVMHNHAPQILMDEPVSRAPRGADFSGRVLVLEMGTDYTIAPTGAYLDDFYHMVTPVEQTYLISKPGHVLFDKIVEGLDDSNAEAHRRYQSGHDRPGGQNPDLETAVRLTFTDFEMHQWKTMKKEYWLLLRVEIRSKIRTAAGTSSDTTTIRVKVPADTDIFEVAAQHYCRYLAAQLGEGV